jgi:hypothetical protein
LSVKRRTIYIAVVEILWNNKRVVEIGRELKLG